MINFILNKRPLSYNSADPAKKKRYKAELVSSCQSCLLYTSDAADE